MKKYIKIEDLCCAHCASKIEKAASAIEGVNSCKVSFMAEKMIVEYDDGADFDAIYKEIVKICKRVEPDCTVSI
ncbi:MAG: heavy-metal-associated domain-containing protein [Clostridia bacterium]|jgi:copper chaperone CopZ|nr:heavy-metal-associated domain-containing protein [Clostridia bacterium]MBO7399107.1 heavy-metal-associated domain-containing protein [Clostridia bacterium]MBO7659242.1 heavy-metal-associated domain-containing protein [Clostridia bacterium]MBP5665374.1 heavy-metal-associated domain-containing protein [Clostridia bacterium]MBP5767102.1 heavy-metal-associated domain-containing protein [Clostridia bacterium]